MSDCDSTKLHSRTPNDTGTGTVAVLGTGTVAVLGTGTVAVLGTGTVAVLKQSLPMFKAMKTQALLPVLP